MGSDVISKGVEIRDARKKAKDVRGGYGRESSGGEEEQS